MEKNRIQNPTTQNKPRKEKQRRKRGRQPKNYQNQTQKSNPPRSHFGHHIIKSILIRTIISQTQTLTHSQSTSSPSENPYRLMRRRKPCHQLVVFRRSYLASGGQRGSRTRRQCSRSTTSSLERNSAS